MSPTMPEIARMLARYGANVGTFYGEHCRAFRRVKTDMARCWGKLAGLLGQLCPDYRRGVGRKMEHL